MEYPSPANTDLEPGSVWTDAGVCDDWQAVSLTGVLGLAGFVAYVLLGRSLTGDGWVPILDSANLAIHEAGHPILGLLSGRLMVYGGTLFQLLFPALVAIQFLRRRESVGFAFGLAWLGENLLNVARYMADARAHLLPLVGGGEHDWTEIFARWGLLERDTIVAGFTGFLGWMTMIAALAWLFLKWQGQRSSAAIRTGPRNLF